MRELSLTSFVAAGARARSRPLEPVMTMTGDGIVLGRNSVTG
jgi:hypothetical protein